MGKQLGNTREQEDVDDEGVTELKRAEKWGGASDDWLKGKGEGKELKGVAQLTKQQIESKDWLG